MRLKNVERNERLEEIFNRVAANFDSIGPKYFSYFGKKLVEYAKVNGGVNLLDIACGRGASLFPAICSVEKNGQVIGVDFSQEMIKETQSIISLQSLCNVKLIQMDAEKLDFPDSSFDNVLCGLSIPFFSDSLRAINEMYRVLKEGGRLGLSTWKKREKKGVLDKVYTKLFLENQDSNSKNTTSRPDFGSVEGIEKIFKNAGFKNIEIFVEKKTFYYKDAEEWWQEQWSNATRGLFEHIESIGPDALERFKKAVFIEIMNNSDANGIRFDANVLFSFGHK